jgi:hypothetical protein
MKRTVFFFIALAAVVIVAGSGAGWGLVRLRRGQAFEKGAG